jgi:threonine synthase
MPCSGGVPIVAMATAHPAKFPDAMEQATGQRPPLPPQMADLFEREERFTILPNDRDAVEAAVRALTGRNAPR